MTRGQEHAPEIELDCMHHGQASLFVVSLELHLVEKMAMVDWQLFRRQEPAEDCMAL